MARWNTPVTDYSSRVTGNLIDYRVKDGPKRKHPYGNKTLQEGTNAYTRKKKKGCKLISSDEIRRSSEGSKLSKVMVPVTETQLVPTPGQPPKSVPLNDGKVVFGCNPTKAGKPELVKVTKMVPKLVRLEGRTVHCRLAFPKIKLK